MKALLKLTMIATLVIAVSFSSFACDESSANLISAVDNGDGTYTYEVEVCAEYNGLEGNPSDLIFNFGGPPINAGFSPSSYTTSGGDVYGSSLLSSNTILEYATGSIFIVQSSSSCCLCTTFTITTTGFSTNLDIRTNDFPAAECVISLALPDFTGGCVGPPAFVGN